MATETFIIDLQTRGARSSARNIDAIGRSANQVRKTMALLRNTLVLVASLRVFTGLANDIAQFSDSMSTVRAVTRATETEFMRLRNTAKDLGATTRFTAGEAADGMAFLGRAGFSTAEILGTIPSVLNLASAGMLDLGDAADIASNILTAFGLDVSKTTDVVDQLVFTANNANTSVKQMADGIKLVAPVASGLGVQLNTVSAAMAVLGDNGIQASLAGTGFRRVLTDLEAPTGALKKILDALNIGFEEVQPSAVGFVGALERLREAGVGATLASQAFGKRGGFIFSALVRDIEAVKDFEESLLDVSGTSAEAARIQEDNLAGAFRATRSAIQAVIIALGDLGAEESLKSFFFGLANALRALARNVDDVVAAMKVLLTVFVVRHVLSFAAAIVRTAVAFRSLNVIMAANPFGIALSALTLLTAGLVLFRDEIKVTEDGTGTLADTFTAFGNTVGVTVLDAVNSLGGEFNSFGEIASRVATRVGQGFNGLLAVIAGLVAAAKVGFKELQLAFNVFLLGFEAGVAKVQSGVNNLVGFFGQGPVFDLDDNVDSARELAKEIANIQKELDDTGTVGEAFFRGGREFLQAREDATQARLTAERDAAILRTEEANRRAAQQRIVAPDKPTFAGISLDLDADKTADEIESLTDALRGLEAQFFPMIAATQAVADAQKTINEAKEKGIELLVDEDELIRRVRRQQLGAGETLDQLKERQQALNIARREGVITLQEEERLSRAAAISFLEGQTDAASGADRAILKLVQNSTDAAGFMEQTFTDAFKSIEDSIVGFVETGKFEIDDFFRNFASQLIRLGTQQAIAGIGGSISGLVGGLGGGGATTGAAGIGGLVTGLLGFQNGGSFNVGPSTSAASLPGVDNRLVAFRAKDGENVQINKPGESGGGGRPIMVNFNFPPGTDAESFRRSEGQIAARMSAALQRANSRNN